MSRADFRDITERAARRRAWVSIALGLAGGVGAAMLAAWTARSVFAPDPPEVPPAHVAEALPVFRLPSGREHAMIVAPAGPDGTGERRLAARLFPGERPGREFASVFVANGSETDSWDVDLDARPLRFRAGEGGDWASFESLADRLEGASAELADRDRLRLRGLGAGASAFTLGPRSCRRVLVALPARRQFRDLSDVEWGDEALKADELSVEEYRALRQDPTRQP